MLQLMQLFRLQGCMNKPILELDWLVAAKSIITGDMFFFNNSQ